MLKSQLSGESLHGSQAWALNHCVLSQAGDATSA